MKCLLLTILTSLALPIAPVLSHGSKGLEECIDYYCPPENIKDKKGNEKRFVPLKRKSVWQRMNS